MSRKRTFARRHGILWLATVYQCIFAVKGSLSDSVRRLVRLGFVVWEELILAKFKLYEWSLCTRVTVYWLLNNFTQHNFSVDVRPHKLRKEWYAMQMHCKNWQNCREDCLIYYTLLYLISILIQIMSFHDLINYS